MLSATRIRKTVMTQSGPLTILDNVNLSLAAGKSLAIVGASGSGKSTLLGILAGLDTPSEGDVIMDGQSITALTEDERATIRLQSVSFVFQSFQLLPGLSALENVLLPLELKGVGNARDKAEHYLTQVGLAERLHHFPPQLSGGEQQRVAVARAFANEPRILFADEPTGNLDAQTGERIIDLLFDMNQRSGTTLVLVTHEQRLAARCHQQLVIQAGKVAQAVDETGRLQPC